MWNNWKCAQKGKLLALVLPFLLCSPKTWLRDCTAENITHVEKVKKEKWMESKSMKHT